MKKVVLANIDYRRHMTDEGEQLQAGLAAAGWWLAGYGYHGERKLDSTNVREILRTLNPDVVLVQDKRDWDPANPGCFNRMVGFLNIESLAAVDRKYAVIGVLKDAGNHNQHMVQYQNQSAHEIRADALVVYWSLDSVRKFSPWASEYSLIRTYHTVDACLCDAILPLHAIGKRSRRRGLVSGANNPDVYPIRAMARKHARYLSIDDLKFPGYGNHGCKTPEYLFDLSGYKVHVATASIYGAALRKIIESVAMGTKVVTDLPQSDPLPYIDEALVRIPQSCTVRELKDAIDRAEAEWNPESAEFFAERARAWYDYRAAGVRLDAAICDLVTCHVQN